MSNIPSFKPESTRDVIIHTLVEEWPLSIKQLYLRIKGERPISYHAIYKIVKQLEEEGVLVEKSYAYSISNEWVNHVKDFSNILTATQTTQSARKEGENSVFTFNSIADADNFLIWVKRPEKNSPKIVHCKHMWWALFHPELAFHRLNRDKLFNHETYVLCRGNTKIDKWCASFEKRLDKNIILGQDVASNCDLFIYGDVIYEVHYPEKLISFLTEEYSKADKLEDLELENLMEKFYTAPCEVMISISKSEKLSERIKHETIEKFKRIS